MHLACGAGRPAVKKEGMLQSTQVPKHVACANSQPSGIIIVITVITVIDIVIVTLFHSVTASIAGNMQHIGRRVAFAVV